MHRMLLYERSIFFLQQWMQAFHYRSKSKSESSTIISLGISIQNFNQFKKAGIAHDCLLFTLHFGITCPYNENNYG